MSLGLRKPLKVQAEGKINFNLTLAVNLPSDYAPVSALISFPPAPILMTGPQLLQTWLLAPFMSPAETPDSSTVTTVYHLHPDTS